MKPGLVVVTATVVLYPHPYPYEIDDSIVNSKENR